MIQLDRITDQVGYLAMSDDGAVLSSGGELENNENVANIILGMISLTDKLGPEDESYKKLSITFANSSYIICLSNKTIYVVKKRFELPSEDSKVDDVIPQTDQNNVVTV